MSEGEFYSVSDLVCKHGVGEGPCSQCQAEVESWGGGRVVKWHCDECEWRGNRLFNVKFKLPAGIDAELYVCPECGTESGVHVACDKPQCWRPASCGTPTPDGYRNTCGLHVPKATA